MQTQKGRYRYILFGAELGIVLLRFFHKNGSIAYALLREYIIEVKENWTSQNFNTQ